MYIAALHEGVAVFRFRAMQRPGAASITFAASRGDRSAKLESGMSIRPASAYVAEISAGYFRNSTDVAIPRTLYPNFRKLDVAVSSLPLVLAGGLAEYLNDYPHLCTEQLVSRAFSALIVARRPELAEVKVSGADRGAATASMIRVLRSRQNADGGFGLWAASVDADEFASVYAVHWLIEARGQGEAIPDDLLQRALVWLQRYAASPVRDDGASELWGLRNRAYAAYLLTRQGTVTTPILTGLRETLDARFPREWQRDIAAAYLAAAYQLQKQEHEAAVLIEHLGPMGAAANPRTAGYYYDDSARDAQILYLLSRHFPARARALSPQMLQTLVAPLNRGEYNTLSAAYLMLALDAYAAELPSDGATFTASETAATPAPNGKAVDTPLALSGKLVQRANYSGAAVKLHLGNSTGLTGFFAVVNAGFDKTPPDAELHDGLEIFREYLDAEGRPVTTLKAGEEITVRLRLRAIDADFIPNVAVTDLLPGGFEPLLGSAVAGRWQPAFVDMREDRVVLYGGISKQLAEFSYRIRATNAGVFLVPPSYAESMYDRKLRARTHAGGITVEPPAAVPPATPVKP